LPVTRLEPDRAGIRAMAVGAVGDKESGMKEG